MADTYELKDDPSVHILANEIREETIEAVALWCGGLRVVEHDALNHSITYPALNVPTSLGMRRAQEGDFVVQRPAGDFLAVSRQMFLQRYVPVTPTTPI